MSADNQNQTDNPAKRLSEFFKRARDIQSGRVADQFATLLNVPAGDFAAIYSGLAILLRMVDEVEMRLRAAHPEYHEIYFESVGRLKQFFSPFHMGQDW